MAVGWFCAPELPMQLRSISETASALKPQALFLRTTINTLNAKMKIGEPITQLAAYDYRESGRVQSLRHKCESKLEELRFPGVAERTCGVARTCGSRRTRRHVT
jgi:hypothetical protein